MTEFVQMSEADLKGLKDFAAPIWYECYDGIVAAEHTEMLIEKYFEYENIKKFINEGTIYLNIVQYNARAGFAAFYLTDTYLYLDKLYLLKEYRGRHLSSETFRYLERKYGLPIRLNVNRNNERAIRAYKGNGFCVIKKEEIPQKGGFVNCDYVMERSGGNSLG
ncbi:MAG: GNAT family N-acetyltransferase [Firmicutes bacterium]|nr:GNAT family N-acetyltransferase [[Eubacterium] siraeum]MCM1488672.1 GNAT family N-acetyltransferase [Bacillota bacterium]